jgi:CRP/FNR family transcriptional regulator, anaerobic regulatory protein
MGWAQVGIDVKCWAISSIFGFRLKPRLTEQGIPHLQPSPKPLCAIVVQHPAYTTRPEHNIKLSNFTTFNKNIRLTKRIIEPLFNFLELFQKMADEDKRIICQNVIFEAFKEGEILLQEGKLAKELFFICRGVLKIVSISDKGNEVIHYFLKENQFCTILKSFNENIISEDRIQAACDAEVIVFQKDRLLFLYQSIPHFKNLLENIIQQSLLDKIEIRNLYLGEDATARYQKFIARQSEIALRVSQTDIASYLGITKQSLSRIRKNIH